MLRRLHPEQPESFAFTPANEAWARGQMTKYPPGRQASAIIPLLWRAQEQEGWLSRPAIEHVAEMLDMAYIRALEVATFYFMFQLAPVGSVAHVQVCGTLSCMICGAEDLMEVCKRKIAKSAHHVSDDGKFSWEEVECLGSCSNAPMVQIGKDYYEDLTAARFEEILDELAAGRVPLPGPQNGRYAAEPLSGLTSLTEYDKDRLPHNASVQLAVDKADTVKRIDGTEEPLTTPWLGKGMGEAPAAEPEQLGAAQALAEPEREPKSEAGMPKRAAPAAPSEPGTAAPVGAKPATTAPADVTEQVKPATLDSARSGSGDDLKKIKGVGPKLEAQLQAMGFYHFDQIAAWTPAEVAWVDENLEGFKGRVSRDGWVDQAKLLAAGGETEFSKRVDKGDVY